MTLMHGRRVHALLSVVGTTAVILVCALLFSYAPAQQLDTPPRQATELDFNPPWEQRPPQYNRYRFAKGGQMPGRMQQLLIKGKPLMAKPAKQMKPAKGVRVQKKKHLRSGQAVFDRMVGALTKSSAVKKGKAAGASKGPMPPRFKAARPDHFKAFKQGLAQALEEDKEEEDEDAIDVNADAPADTVYVYRGREVKAGTDELVTFILAGGFGVGDVKYIESSSDADVRSALWDKDCEAVVIPPLHDIPDFGPNAVKDFQAYVSQGFKNHGTVLFLGSSVEVHLMNKMFGYELQQDFKPGPYYKSDRHTMGTALAGLPERVNELGNTESLGILKSSIPPEGLSFYDSFGDSVAMCARYNLGRVCYLAQDFHPLQDMPQLQVEMENGSDEEAAEAERRLEALGRRTDTWLAMFQSMLTNPNAE